MRNPLIGSLLVFAAVVPMALVAQSTTPAVTRPLRLPARDPASLLRRRKRSLASPSKRASPKKRTTSRLLPVRLAHLM
jgi:hypothetical protein